MPPAEPEVTYCRQSEESTVASNPSPANPGRFIDGVETRYRGGRSAQDAVKHVHELLNTGHGAVVDADLTDYFGQIPHAELLRSVARRVSDGPMLGWVKAWLELAVALNHDAEDRGVSDATLKLTVNAKKTRCCRVPEGTHRVPGLPDRTQLSTGYGASLHRHATRRLRQWLCRKRKVRSGKHVRFLDTRLWKQYGFTRLAPRTVSFPWARA